MPDKQIFFSHRVISFLSQLNTAFKCPSGVDILHPYQEAAVQKVVNKYYKKYYTTKNKRIFLFGINPGRMGAGITGISFTDPVHLSNDADIKHPFPMKTELSSQFMHKVFKELGGIEKFSSHFYLTSICPLGFIKEGKNLNYYDSPLLQKRAQPFIVESMLLQIQCGAFTEVAICLGEGQNYKYFKGLNDKQKWFKEIIPLPHPRFIMQYKRKEMNTFISQYVSTLSTLKNLLEKS